MSTISQLNGQERLNAAMATAALRKNAAGSGMSSPAAARQPDAVTISDSARSIAAATRAVSDAPAVREDRVNELKAAIAAGTYSVDSRRLASKLITSLAI
jgi:negative regulator of flagellin synthesis FlgM